MKRWIALLAVIAVFCAMALGSGHKRPVDISEPDVEALKPKEKPASTAETLQEAEEEPAGPSFEETVLYDRGGVKLTAAGITYGEEGPSVRCTLENRSSHYIRATCASLDVNGYYTDASMDLICGPDREAEGKIPVSPDLLAVCGINEIAQLDLKIDLTNAFTGKALPGVEGVRLKTDAAEDKPYAADKTGRLVYYDKGVEITVKGRDARGHRCDDLVLCLACTRDEPVRVELYSLTVNGARFDAELSAVVPAGKTAIAVLRIPRAELAKRGLEPVERYRLNFSVCDEASGDLLAITDAKDIRYEDLLPLP